MKGLDNIGIDVLSTFTPFKHPNEIIKLLFYVHTSYNCIFINLGEGKGMGGPYLHIHFCPIQKTLLFVGGGRSRFDTRLLRDSSTGGDNRVVKDERPRIPWRYSCVRKCCTIVLLSYDLSVRGYQL